MKIYIGWTESHGKVCYADSYKKVIKFFIEDGWIDEDTKFDNWDDNETTIKKEFGNDWKDSLLSLDEEEFCWLFADRFGIQEENLL